MDKSKRPEKIPLSIILSLSKDERGMNKLTYLCQKSKLLKNYREEVIKDGGL